MDPITVSEALRRQLEGLCLKSFPCGPGSWNKSHPATGNKTPIDAYWEDDDPGDETQDALCDLLNQPRSPWEPDDKRNSEVQHLRELAVKCPEKITDQFICSYFRQLRIVDEEVLELCYNHISSLKDLSINPPPLLQHLGLAYNRIQCSSQSMFLTADIWPNLVSLDLSFNDLTDLFSLVSRISTLQSLRVLTLQGNPLAFITTYRGYTIDCLPQLFVLDEILILPDERHKFSGLSKKKEILENIAKLCVRIGKVQGIPNPNVLTEQPNPGDYPITTITYHVCYDFMEDQPSGDTTQCQPHMFSPMQQTPEEDIEQPDPLNIHTGLYKTVGSHWDESIEQEYVREHTAADLLALKSFLLSGMKVSVTEEKILSWPKDPEENATLSKQDKQVGGKEKDKARSSSGSKTDGKSKKKKENLVELRHDPPIVRTLGTAVMSLRNLVSGDMKTFSVCNLEPCYNNVETQRANDKSPEKGNKTKERKPKSGRERAETPKTPRSSSGKHKDAETKPAEEEPPPPIAALTVEIEVQLVC
ncbi:leucine-rich repeat-containing protein 43 isoform X2 [Dendropsophus ebraccatus]|uniref:leucine-rich repeat-containing protein 43 isoform X2 n=1 Tax=Dendropsophus ebraccatus TaxID=150705 RepID=UPI0038312579